MTVIFKILGLDVAVNPSDFNNFSFCSTSKSDCNYGVTNALPTPWKQEKSQKPFYAPSLVQDFSAFDLCETKW